MNIDQPTTLPAGEFEFKVPAGWTHFGDDSRVVLQKPEVELIATVLTGWAEGDRRMITSATKTAIRSAEDAAKAEGLEPPTIDASLTNSLWTCRSNAKDDGAFFGQFVLTGELSVIYLSVESLSAPKDAVALFDRLVETAKTKKSFSL